jgi:hypothetical protein
MSMDLTKEFSQNDGILDFLGDQISLQVGPNTKEVGIEIDYKWGQILKRLMRFYFHDWT